MTISSTKRWLGWLLFLLSYTVFPQDELTAFWQPQVAINYQVVDDYSHNFTLANRNFIYSEDAVDLSVRQLDLSHFSKLKIRDNQSLSLGLLWRNSKIFNEDRVDEYRITEQYNITLTPLVVRFGHRLRAEQRISSVRTIHRFRYRFAIDFPLAGEKLDVGESYALASIESLLSVARTAQAAYDLRLRGGWGWRLSPKSNLQMTLEYRLLNYTRMVDHVLLLETALNLGL